MDIVYGAYWLAGPDFVPRTFRPNHATKEYLRANSDHVYDVDGDGWPDVIAGGWGEEGVYWYKNPGRSAAERGAPWEMHRPWEARRLTRTRGHMEMFALHDYDADGIPEPAGTFTRHTIAAAGDGIALGRQYSVVDLNRDGRLDLTAPSELGLWVFFNEGYR